MEKFADKTKQELIEEIEGLKEQLRILSGAVKNKVESNEISIEQNKELLMQIYNSSSDLMALLKVETKDRFTISSFNNSYYKTAQTLNPKISHDKLTGIDIFELGKLLNWPEETINSTINDYKKVLKSGLSLLKVEKVSLNDSTTYFDSTFTPIFSKNGKCEQILYSARNITDNEQDRIALKRSEEKYKIISEMISDYAYAYKILDDDTLNPEWVTAGFEKITGYTYEESEKKGGWSTLIYPEDIQFAKTRFQNLIQGKKDVSEFRIKTKNGEIKWIRDFGYPEWDKNKNRTVRIFGAAIDITWQKFAEKSLADSELRYRNLFDSSPIPLWEEDFTELQKYFDQLQLKGELDIREYFNNKPEELFACKKRIFINDINNATIHLHEAKNKEEVYRNFDNIFTEKSLLVFKEIVIAIASGKKEFSAETETKTLSGIVKQIEIRMKVDPHQPRALLATLDITDRKKAEENVQRQIFLNKQILETTMNGYILADDKGKILETNPAYCQMIGYEAKEIEKMNIRQLEVQIPDKEIQRRIDQFVRKGHDRFETQHKRKDGKIIDLNVNISILHRDQKPLVAAFVNDITEQNKIQQSLKESEEKYRVLVESSNDSIFIVQNGLIQFVNEKLIEISEYQKDQILGKSFLDFVSPHEKEKVRKNYINRVAGNEVPDFYETVAVSQSGRQIPVEVNIIPIQYEGNSAIQVICRDLSKRKQAEQELRKSEEKYSNIVNNANDGIYLRKMDGTIIYANKKFCEIHEYDLDEILGRKSWEFLHPNSLKNIIESGEMDKIQHGAQSKGEEIGMTKSGKDIYLDIRTSPLIIDGKNEGVFGIIRDITDRVRSEQKLKQQEKELNTIIDNLPLTLFVKDAKTLSYQRFNSAGEELLGFKREDLYGKNNYDIFNKEDADFFRAQDKEVLKTGQILDIPEEPINTPKGKRILRTKKVAINDDEGIPKYILSISEDITQRIQAEKLKAVQLDLIDYSTNHTVKDILKKFLDEAERLTDSNIGFYHFVEDDQETIHLQTWSNNTMQNMCSFNMEDHHYPISEAGVWVDCVKERKPVVHNDYESLQHKKGTPEGHAKIIRELVVPVIRSEKIMAILGVGNKVSDYTNDDVSILQQMADLAWEVVERKIAEENLRKSENMLKQLFNNMNNGALVLKATNNGSDFIITDFNKASEKIENRTKNDVIGKSILDSFPRIKETGFFDALKRVYQTGIPENMPAIFKEKGQIIYWQLNYIYKLQTGEVVTVYEDVTDQKKTEESLRIAEEQYRIITESTIDIIFIVNKTGKQLYFNEAVKSVLGYEQAEVIGKSFIGFVPKRQLPKYFEMLKEVFRNKEITHFSTQVYHKDGHLVDVEISGKLTKYKGKIVAQGTMRDITWRLNAEKELGQHRKNLEEMVKKRTAELEERNKELQRFYDATIDREFRIKELRDEIEKLKKTQQ